MPVDRKKLLRAVPASGVFTDAILYGFQRQLDNLNSKDRFHQPAQAHVSPDKARENLIDFTRYTFRGFQENWHHRKMGAFLDRFARGEILRGMVFMPPRHSKSEFVSRRTVAKIFGNRPDARIILSSYSFDLAAMMSRDALRIVQDPAYQGLFPDTQLDGKATDAFWEINNGQGYCRAAGVGGGITGMGASFAIIDDPIKNYEEAMSETVRESLWNWYLSTLMTRLEQPGAILITMCMTGDTPVRMSDGTERQLRDIRPGDSVATFDNGVLASSNVVNHKSQGRDNIYKVITTSGRVVRANARHPFLVHDGGNLRWERLRNLTTDHTIVVVKDSGGSGEGLSAKKKDATKQRQPAVCVGHTIKNTSGQAVTDLRPTTQQRGEPSESSNATESRRNNTRQNSPNRVGFAQYAGNRPEKTLGRIGAGNYASTTITTPESSEDCFATIAISPLDTPNPPTSLKPSLDTCDFTTEQIASIEPDGVEEVFDVQIDRTENFIANGVVSHNTRWHEDDLAGRLLKQMRDDPAADQWEILDLPALATDDGVYGPRVDERERKVGDPLWPARFPLSTLMQRKHSLGDWWDAMYQQRPTTPGGTTFQAPWFVIVNVLPSASMKRVRFWDVAGTKGGGDYTVGTLMAEHPSKHWFIEDVVRGQWDSGDVDKQILQTARRDAIKYGPRAVKIREEQEGGSSGKAVINARRKLLAGYDYDGVPATGKKELRWNPMAAQAKGGNIYLLAGPWVPEWLDEIKRVPKAANDDQADSAAGAFNELTLGKVGGMKQVGVTGT